MKQSDRRDMTYEMDDDAANFHKDRSIYAGKPLIWALSWSIWRITNGHRSGNIYPPEPQKVERIIKGYINGSYVFVP